MSLSIVIQDDGQALISVNGVVISYVKSINIVIDEREHSVPHIAIALHDPDDIKDSTLRVSLRRMLLNYKMALALHPLIRIAGYRNTLREFPAVPPSEPKV